LHSSRGSDDGGDEDAVGRDVNGAVGRSRF
jgi:hypothetical protein